MLHDQARVEGCRLDTGAMQPVTRRQKDSCK
jgi:hypothetical protein